MSGKASPRKRKRKPTRNKRSSRSVLEKKPTTLLYQLPLHDCMITRGWEEVHQAHVLVSRKHLDGRISCALYWVDLLCEGVRDSVWFSRLSPTKYAIFKHNVNREFGVLEACPYDLVHNVIYGALAFAEKFQISPHPVFRTTRELLEPADADIEPIDIEFGFGGKPCVVDLPDDEDCKELIDHLRRVVGPGNFLVLSPDEFEEGEPEREFEEWDETMEEDEARSAAMLFEQVDFLYEQLYGDETRKRPAPEFLEHRLTTITGDPTAIPTYFSEEEDPKELQAILEAILSEDKKAVRWSVTKLKELSAAFPENPTYLNHLTIAYQELGEEKKARKLVKRIYEKHPDYLFGKCNYAQLLLEEERAEEVPAVFNNAFELSAIFPGREVFHVSELLSVYSVLCRYFTQIDDLATADIYSQIIQEFQDVAHPLRDQAVVQLKAKKLEKILEHKDFIDFLENG